MSEKDISELFMNTKPVLSLVAIRRAKQDVYVSIISKKIDTTYAHTCKIMEELDTEGYIDKEQKGRKNLLYLTEKGEKVADKFEEVLEALDSKYSIEEAPIETENRGKGIGRYL